MALLWLWLVICGCCCGGAAALLVFEDLVLWMEVQLVLL